MPPSILILHGKFRVVLPLTSGGGILEGVVRRLIRRIGKTDQAFRLGDGPAVRTSLNSSGWSLRRNDSAIKRSVGLAAPVLDVLQVRRFLGRLDHPELIRRREIQWVSPGGLAATGTQPTAPGTLAVEMNGTAVWW